MLLAVCYSLFKFGGGVSFPRRKGKGKGGGGREGRRGRGKERKRERERERERERGREREREVSHWRERERCLIGRVSGTPSYSMVFLEDPSRMLPLHFETNRCVLLQA